MPSTLASRITAVLGTGAVVLAAATGQASGALVTAPVIGTTPNLIADRPFTYPLALAWDITTIGSKTYAVTVATAQGGMVNVIELDTDVAHTGANDATINIFNGPMETSTTEWGASQSTVLPDKSVLFGTNRGGLVWVRPGPSAPATQKALFHLPFAVSTAGADAAKRYYSSISDYTTMLNTYTISHHGDTTTVVFVALRSNQGMDGKIVAYNYDCMSRVTTTIDGRACGPSDPIAGVQPGGITDPGHPNWWTDFGSIGGPDSIPMGVTYGNGKVIVGVEGRAKDATGKAVSQKGIYTFEPTVAASYATGGTKIGPTPAWYAGHTRMAGDYLYGSYGWYGPPPKGITPGVYTAPAGSPPTFVSDFPGGGNFRLASVPYPGQEGPLHGPNSQNRVVFLSGGVLRAFDPATPTTTQALTGPITTIPAGAAVILPTSQPQVRSGGCWVPETDTCVLFGLADIYLVATNPGSPASSTSKRIEHYNAALGRQIIFGSRGGLELEFGPVPGTPNEPRDIFTATNYYSRDLFSWNPSVGSPLVAHLMRPDGQSQQIEGMAATSDGSTMLLGVYSNAQVRKLNENSGPVYGAGSDRVHAIVPLTSTTYAIGTYNNQVTSSWVGAYDLTTGADINSTATSRVPPVPDHVLLSMVRLSDTEVLVGTMHKDYRTSPGVMYKCDPANCQPPTTTVTAPTTATTGNNNPIAALAVGSTSTGAQRVYGLSRSIVFELDPATMTITNTYNLAADGASASAASGTIRALADGRLAVVAGLDSAQRNGKLFAINTRAPPWEVFQVSTPGESATNVIVADNRRWVYTTLSGKLMYQCLNDQPGPIDAVPGVAICQG